MSRAFHNIVRFKCFTDLNLNTPYVFKVIQNWETDTLQYILFGGAYFLSAVKVEEGESSWLKIAATSRRFWPATGPY